MPPVLLRKKPDIFTTKTQRRNGGIQLNNPSCLCSGVSGRRPEAYLNSSNLSFFAWQTGHSSGSVPSDTYPQTLHTQ